MYTKLVMGAFFGNIAIKTDNRDGVVKTIKESGEPMFIAGPVDGWLLLFPSDDFKISKFAQKFSKEFNTISFSGQVFDSDDLFINFYSNGEPIVDYLYDRMDGGGPQFNGGDEKTFKDFFHLADTKKIHEALFEDGGDYVFIEGRYQDFLKACGLPLALGNLWGYEYIERASDDGRSEEEAKDLPNLEKIF